MNDKIFISECTLSLILNQAAQIAAEYLTVAEEEVAAAKAGFKAAIDDVAAVDLAAAVGLAARQEPAPVHEMGAQNFLLVTKMLVKVTYHRVKIVFGVPSRSVRPRTVFYRFFLQ